MPDQAWIQLLEIPPGPHPIVYLSAPLQEEGVLRRDPAQHENPPEVGDPAWHLVLQLVDEKPCRLTNSVGSGLMGSSMTEVPKASHATGQPEESSSTCRRMEPVPCRAYRWLSPTCQPG